MKRIKIYSIPVIALLLILFSCGRGKEIVTLTTRHLGVGIDSKGYLSSMKDLNSNTDYMAKEELSPLMVLYTKYGDSIEYLPQKAIYDEASGIITMDYPNGSAAKIKIENKQDYLRFELLSVEPRNDVVYVTWGPVNTSIGETVGEIVGVTRNKDFAIGAQALDIKTLGGKNKDFRNYAQDNWFIDPLPGQEFPDSLKDQIRKPYPGVYNLLLDGDYPEYVRCRPMEAAYKTSFGSVLRFNVRDMRIPKEIMNPDSTKQYVPSIDVDFVGSAIALFGCPEPDVLDHIEIIELGEDLPHPMLDGIWIKRHPRLNEAYMMHDFNMHNMVEILKYARACNFKLVHANFPCKTWGHFDLHTETFPNGAADIKKVLDKAREEGVIFGMHTLSMFIQRNDPYITPVPSDSLCLNGSSVLTRDIGENDDVIYIEDPAYFYYLDLTHTAKIGKELIRYASVSGDQPWRLLDCQRGTEGTKRSAHTKGTKIDKLRNDSYAGFYPDIYLQDEMADKLAEICNTTGIGHMEFDGYADTWATGFGIYKTNKFIKRWYDKLDKEKYVLCGGAGANNYYWHIYTRHNNGEPWYDFLRESMINYRLENMRVAARNYSPGMMGWFVLRNTFRLEETEFIQALSAGYDAGYLLVVNASIEANPLKEQHFEAIREWQEARKLKAFSAEQRQRLSDPKNSFHLEKAGDKSWNLYPVCFDYKNQISSENEGQVTKTFLFNNVCETQLAEFYIKATGATMVVGDRRHPKPINTKSTFESIQVSINGTTMTMPFPLSLGKNIYCDGRSVYLCDETWNRLEEVKMDIPVFKNGDNKIEISGIFKGKDGPYINCEFKTTGKPEMVTASS